jgi:hypothetical protein
MWTAIKSLFSSPHGLLGVALLVAATVLVVLGKMDVVSWQSFAQWIFGAFVAGTTVTAAAASFATRYAVVPAAATTPRLVPTELVPEPPKAA